MQGNQVAPEDSQITRRAKPEASVWISPRHANSALIADQRTGGPRRLADSQRLVRGAVSNDRGWVSGSPAGVPAVCSGCNGKDILRADAGAEVSTSVARVQEFAARGRISCRLKRASAETLLSETSNLCTGLSTLTEPCSRHGRFPATTRKTSRASPPTSWFWLNYVATPGATSRSAKLAWMRPHRWFPIPPLQ